MRFPKVVFSQSGRRAGSSNALQERANSTAAGLLTCPMYSAMGLRISSIWKMRWGMMGLVPS